MPVQGTGGWSNDRTRPGWWKYGHELHTYLYDELGIDYHYSADPFVWNTDVNGLRTLHLLKKILRGGKPTAKHADWISSARGLRFALDRVPLKDRNLVCHSHGGQLAFYAAEQDATTVLRLDNDEPLINFLLTIGTPIRKDMFRVLRLGRKNIKTWYHVQDVDQDWVQWAGSVTLTSLSWVWGRLAWPQDIGPDRVITPADIGHSGILHGNFERIEELGLFEPIIEVA